MIRDGKRRIRRALSAPSSRAMLSLLKNGDSHAKDRQSLVGSSTFYDDEILNLEVCY